MGSSLVRAPTNGQNVHRPRYFFAKGIASQVVSDEPRDDEPTQETQPKKGEPATIPVPKKGDVLRDLEKVAKKRPDDES
jgi:hypothetical protein